MFFDQIINGTKNILDLAINAGVKRFLYISSGAIYGSQPADLTSIPETCGAVLPHHYVKQTLPMVREKEPPNTFAYYRANSTDWKLSPRCFSFVGPDLPIDAHFAIGNFIRDAITANVITVQGDGSPLRTYLDQSDLARWLIALLDQGRNGEAYNVGSNEIISIAEVAKLVRDVLAPEKEVIIEGNGNTDCERKRYIPDISKVEREFHLKLTIRLEEAIRRTGRMHLA